MSKILPRFKILNTSAVMFLSSSNGLYKDDNLSRIVPKDITNAFTQKSRTNHWKYITGTLLDTERYPAYWNRDVRHKVMDKGKGKGHPIPVHEDPEGEQMYSSTLPSTSTLDGGGWSTPRSGRFTPRGKTRYPLYRRLSGPQGRSGMRKISPPRGFDPRTAQPVTSRWMWYFKMWE